MNTRKRLSEIILLTLAVVVGGGFLYFSKLSEIRKDPGTISRIYLQKAESPTVQLNNVNSKKRFTTNRSNQYSIRKPCVVETPLYNEVIEAGASASGSIQSGNTNYTYIRKNRDARSNYQGGSFGSAEILAYGRRGSQTDGEVSTQGTGGITLTETGATSPFAVPKTATENPPSSAGGNILVDPMTDPIVTNQIPVNDGVGLLIMLISAYAGWISFRKRK